MLFFFFNVIIIIIIIMNLLLLLLLLVVSVDSVFKSVCFKEVPSGLSQGLLVLLLEGDASGLELFDFCFEVYEFIFDNIIILLLLLKRVFEEVGESGGG